MTAARPVHLSRGMHDHIAFARFAAEHKIDPTDLARLITLARRASNANVQECNTGKSADNACKRFEEAAIGYGFERVEWNGLGPTLRKNGRDIYLPAV